MGIGAERSKRRALARGGSLWDFFFLFLFVVSFVFFVFSLPISFVRRKGIGREFLRRNLLREASMTMARYPLSRYPLLRGCYEVRRTGRKCHYVAHIRRAVR